MGLWQWLARNCYRRAMHTYAQEPNESPAQHRLRVWRMIGVDMAAHCNPLTAIRSGPSLSHNLDSDHFPDGAESYALPSGSVDLDPIAVADEENLRHAKATLEAHVAGSPADIQMLWVWYVQAGHKFMHQGRPDLALRAYLNELRLRPSTISGPLADALIVRNIALALQELGDFEGAGNQFAVAGHAFLTQNDQTEAAEALECAGLAWERMTDLRPDAERPRLGIAHEKFADYDSTLCFRRAKYLYASNGDFDAASRCTVLERDCDRRWSPSRTRRGVLTIMRAIWLYGESPLRVLVSALVIWIFSAVVYSLAGFAASSQAPVSGLAGLQEFGNALYLSAITMGTVGYGDFVPTATVSRLWAGMEGVSGVLLAAMFLVAMQRRYAGR